MLYCGIVFGQTKTRGIDLPKKAFDEKLALKTKRDH